MYLSSSTCSFRPLFLSLTHSFTRPHTRSLIFFFFCCSVPTLSADNRARLTLGSFCADVLPPINETENDIIINVVLEQPFGLDTIVPPPSPIPLSKYMFIASNQNNNKKSNVVDGFLAWLMTFPFAAMSATFWPLTSINIYYY